MKSFVTYKLSHDSPSFHNYIYTSKGVRLASAKHKVNHTRDKGKVKNNVHK